MAARTGSPTLVGPALTDPEDVRTVRSIGAGHGRSDGPESEAAMKDIRCLVGVHAWSNDLPVGVAAQQGAVTLACRRCGRVARTWKEYRPPPEPPLAGGDGAGAGGW